MDLPQQDMSAYEVLSVVPCDQKLTAFLKKSSHSQLEPLGVSIYEYQWNEIARQTFKLQGTTRNFLSHELESAFPASVLKVKGYFCLRFGILNFYLHHIAPYKLQVVSKPTLGT